MMDATGFSPLVWDAADVLGKNGVLVLASITGGDREATIPSDRINQGFVLGNKVLVGTVNASPTDFTSGVDDLIKAEALLPGLAGLAPDHADRRARALRGDDPGADRGSRRDQGLRRGRAQRRPEVSALARRPPPAVRVRRLAVVDAHEGPVYAADEHALYFTTVPRPTARPRRAIRRLALADRRDGADRRITTVGADANAANGMTLGPATAGLLVCEQGTAAEPARIAAPRPRAPARAETLVDRLARRCRCQLPQRRRRARRRRDLVHRPELRLPAGLPAARRGLADRGLPHRPRPATGWPWSRRRSTSPTGSRSRRTSARSTSTDSGADHEPGAHDGAPHRIGRSTSRRAARPRRPAVRRRRAGLPGRPEGRHRRPACYASSARGIQVFSRGAGGCASARSACPGAVNFTLRRPRRRNASSSPPTRRSGRRSSSRPPTEGA